MSRYIAIEGCKKCPHRHYYSVGLYECLKYGTVLPASHILDIPEWCPLPKLPTPASAPETPAAPLVLHHTFEPHKGLQMCTPDCPACAFQRTGSTANR